MQLSGCAARFGSFDRAFSDMKNSAFRSQPPLTRVTAHALNLGDRISTSGFEKDALSAVPLALRVGQDGIAVLFRYGVAVFLNMSAEEEAAFLERLHPRIGGRLVPPEEEAATVELLGETEDQVAAGGPIHVRDMSIARLLVVSDVLAKSVVLAHDEREVAKVFETIEPFVRELATYRKVLPQPARHPEADRRGASGAAQRLRPGRDCRQARRAVGSALISSGSMRGWKTNTS